MSQLNLTKNQLVIIKDILKNHPDVYAFGSRVKGTHKEFSDIDLCIIRGKAASLSEIALLKEKFEDSDLPFKVDLIDYHSISDDFKKIIDRDKVKI